MRILQVNKLYHPWIGGIETAAKDIAEFYNGKPDTEVVNLVCTPRGKRSVEAVDGVTTYRSATWRIKFGMPLSIDFFILFRKLIQEADVVFIHHPFPLAFVAYWLFGRGKKVVAWYHSDIVRQKILKIPFEPFLRYGLAKAEVIIVSNNTIIRNSRTLAKYASKCKVVYFGVDLARFRLTDEVKSTAHSIRTMIGTPLILSVGRLVYYKGFCHLIDAMKDTAAHLLIVGSGPLENELRSQISELGLVDKVHLVSSVPDLVPYYHACDLFVLPSSEISEVFGIVQIEALACGKPVINTDLPTGVPEVSVHGETGLTVKSKDSIALRSALQKILSDRRAYAQFSHKAISRARSLFSNRAMCESLDRSLREVLSPLPQRTVGHPHPAEPATAGD